MYYRTLSFLFVLTLTILFGGCLEEGYFGLSSFGEIKDIQVSNQAGNAIINSQDKTVKVEIPGGVALDQLTVQVLTLSSFATADIQTGSILDLREPVSITVTAEDGSITVWTLEAFVASSTPQLSNSDFQHWYQVNAGYYEPGEDGNTTIWGTGNPGGALLDKIATTPLEIENGNNAAHLETLDNGFLGQIAGTPITAATIYTGKFVSENIDINDPRAAVDPRARDPRAASRVDPRQQQQQPLDPRSRSSYAAPSNNVQLDPALVQQVMSLTPQQIAQLPPDKQQSILQLRQQITGGKV